MDTGHFDFIEIGTSDFNTLIQKAGNHTVGISVEPIAEYLNRLPDRPMVTKINAAVSDYNGEIDVFYISDAIRKDYGLPAWVKGTNSVGIPHPTIVKYLRKHGLPMTLIETTKVTVVTIKNIFETHGVKSVDFLKIDTEGHDHVILSTYLDMIETAPSLRAKKILFESNSLTPKQTTIEICNRLSFCGYDIETLRQDTIATLK